MNGYFDGSADFFFQDSENKSSNSHLKQWVNRVFADPVLPTHKIASELFNAEYLTSQQEVSLYLDWQTRDTELGFRLLERHREELTSCLDSFRKALAKKRKTVTFTRTRLEALQKINATELNPSLKHPQHIFAQLETEVRTAQEELQTLRYYSTYIETLSTFLKPMVGGTSNENHFLTEQRIRLLGQSWRGWMRIQAFNHSFPNYQFSLPVDDQLPLPISNGFTVVAKNSLSTDLLIPQEAAAYIHHCLHAIKSLSEEVTPYFNNDERKNLPAIPWSNLMVFLRSIVELFYFCWFELPIASNSLIIDIEEPSKFWSYQPETAQWQPTTTESISLQLKREAAILSHFITTTPGILNWRSAEDINISALVNEQSKKGLQLYRSVGLAGLELNPTKHTHKFQSGYKLTGKVIEQIANSDETLAKAFNSSIGGPVETLTAMALLDNRAFPLMSNAEVIPDSERLEILAQFWKAMGKRRPLALLGDAYAKNLSSKLTELGQPALERVSQLSIRLSTMLSRTAAPLGEKGKPISQDLLDTIPLADQIRLVELVSQTWKYVEEVTNYINSAEEHIALNTFINFLPTQVQTYEEEVSKRFSLKWTTAKQPLWQILTASMPMTWDFWTKLASNEAWTQSLTQLAPEDALVTLLSLCADVTRLYVVLETTSPMFSERMNVDAETAGSMVLAAFQRYQNTSGVIDLIRYYYDTEIPHDGWVAFTSSVKSYLQQLQGDLQKFEATAQLEIISNILKQLEITYPTPVIVRKVVKKAVGLGGRIADAFLTKTAILDEKDVEVIEKITSQLIGQETFDQLLILKLTSFFQVKDLKENLYFLVENSSLIKAKFINPRHRKVLFSMPNITQTVSNYLRNLGLAENNDVLSSEVVFQLEEYLSQMDVFNNYIDNILSESPWCPAEDLAELSNLTPNSRANLLIFQVADQVFAFLVREKISETLERIEEFLKSFAVGQLADWKPEYLILGAVGIRKEEKVFMIGSSEICLDPTFSQASEANSERLMMMFLRCKYRLIHSLLGREFPDTQLQTQIS